MLYISIALVLITIIITRKPPTLTIHHKYEIIQPPTTPVNEADQAAMTKQMEDWNKNRPPSMESVVAEINKTIHEIGGSDAD